MVPLHGGSPPGHTNFVAQMCSPFSQAIHKYLPAPGLDIFYIPSTALAPHLYGEMLRHVWKMPKVLFTI